MACGGGNFSPPPPPPVAQGISITPNDGSVQLGASQQFTANETFSDGSKQDVTATVTWNSSNLAAAAISNASGSHGVANGIAEGKTTISATLGSFSASTTLAVVKPGLLSIQAFPANGSIPLTTTLQFGAVGTFSDGSQQDLTALVNWSSSDKTKATISNFTGTEGLATPVAAGASTISASLGSLNYSTGLTVTALAPGQARFAYVTNMFDSTVSLYLVDGSSGQLTPSGPAIFIGQSSFPDAVVADSSGKFLYVGDRDGSRLFAYLIDAVSGFLTPIGTPVYANGPVALAMHPTGKFLLMANSPGTVSTYSIDTTGSATFVGQSAGDVGGALSLAVDPSGQFVYAANVNANTVSGYSLDLSTGLFTGILGSPFSTGPNPNSVSLHPSGRFLYATNGNGQSVSAYTLDSVTGTLTEIAGSPFTVGLIPDAMALDPAGKYLFVVNSASNNLSVLAIDPTTGALQSVAGSPFPAINAAFCATVDSLDKFLYVLNYDSGSISVFQIDPTSGFLTKAGTTPTGKNPISIALVK